MNSAEGPCEHRGQVAKPCSGKAARELACETLLDLDVQERNDLGRASSMGRGEFLMTEKQGCDWRSTHLKSIKGFV